MNWEAIGAIGESLAAIAVIVSLYYVAIQIRQNTRMMRAAAKQSLTESSQAVVDGQAKGSNRVFRVAGSLVVRPH